MINWGPWLFLLILMICSDTILSVIISRSLWTVRGTDSRGLVRCLAIAFAAAALRALSEFIANAFGYIVKPHYTIGFGLSFWIGRALWTGSLWLLWYVITRRGKDG